jgi:hypothetical protein
MEEQVRGSDSALRCPRIRQLPDGRPYPKMPLAGLTR